MYIKLNCSEANSKLYKLKKPNYALRKFRLYLKGQYYVNVRVNEKTVLTVMGKGIISHKG